MRPPNFLMALNWQIDVHSPQRSQASVTRTGTSSPGRFLGERVREVERVRRLDVGVGEDGEDGDARSDGGLAAPPLPLAKRIRIRLPYQEE